MIDLSESRESIINKLCEVIVETSSRRKMLLSEVVRLLVTDVLGNSLVDDDLEENIVIQLANSFDCGTINPEYEINIG